MHKFALDQNLEEEGIVSIVTGLLSDTAEILLAVVHDGERPLIDRALGTRLIDSFRIDIVVSAIGLAGAPIGVAK
jgi:hypothetical protein